MGYKHGRIGGDWEFLRAAHVEQRETERCHNVAITIELAFQTPRSVVAVRTVAYEVAENGSQSQLCAYSHEWPSSKIETFGAAVFQALVRLTRLVEDSRRDEALVGAKRQTAR